MSETLGRLQVDLEARIAKFESDMGRAARILQRDMVRASNASERAIKQMRQSAERDMERIRSSARSASTAVIGFLSIQQGARLIAGLGRVADQYSNIQAKVRLAAGENANLGGSLERVFGVAQRTFNTLDGTASLVQRGATALRNYGQTADQAFSNALQLSEIFNKSLVVSGASSEEAAASALQFSQALASGKFSGDEFRSVMENNSRFAQLLADSLGVNIAELRRMSKEGDLTTQSFLNLIGRTGDLDAQFARMPLTIGRAKTQLDNAFVKFIGDADQAYGASGLVASGISSIARNIGPVVGALTNLGVVAAGAFAGRSLVAMQQFGKAVLDRAKAENIAAAGAAQRAQAEAAANALALTRARAEQINAEVIAQSAAAERVKAEALIASSRAQEVAIRTNALRATSEVELARLSIQLTAIEKERAVATAALGAARQREVAANVALATSNRSLAAAQTAAGVAGAAAATKISISMRAASIATAGMTLATRTLTGAMAALGGPVGLAIIALGLLASKFIGARQEAEALRTSALNAAEGLAALNRESSASQILEAGTAALAKRQELVEAIAKDQAEVDRNTFGGKLLAIDAAGVTERLYSNKAALAEVERQLSRTRVLAEQYRGTQAGVASSTGGASEELTKQAEQLKLQRIELTQGLRARLEYEAVQKAGVKNASELNAATRATIDSIVAEQSAIDSARDSKKQAGKDARAAASEEKRLAKERERAQRQFQDDTDRLAASLGGEYAKASSAYKFALRDITEEYERGGASAAAFARQQELLKQQFDERVAGIRAGALGPEAEAAYAYAQALRQLREDAAAVGLTTDQLAASERRMRIEFAETTKEIHERLDPVGALLEQMQFENDLLGMTNAQRVVANELRRIGIGLTDAELKAAKIALEAKAMEAEALRKQIAAMDEFRSTLESNIASVLDGSKSIKEAFTDMANAIIAQIARMIAQQWVEKLFGSMGSSGGGSMGGGIMSFIGSFFGGGRALGGPVKADSIYEVGEQGKPEVFRSGNRTYLIPGNDGQVTPMHSGGGKFRDINISLSLRENTTKQTMQQVASQIATTVSFAARAS